MTPHHHFKSRSLILAAALFGGLANPAIARDHTYLIDLDSRTATELGSLDSDVLWHGRNSAINDAGQIVGSYGGAPSHAFITGPDGMGLSDLGTLDGRRWSFARDFNDAGQVVFEKLYGCRICNPCRTPLRAAYYFRS